MITERQQTSGFPMGVLFILFLGAGLLFLLPTLGESIVHMGGKRSLPPLPRVLPEGVAPIPDHIMNHPNGESAARAKGWSWIQAYLHPGPPNWCGIRWDNAVVYFYNITVFGKKGVALIINNGGNNFSTVLTGVKWDGFGTPNSQNSSGNDFEEFEYLPPDQCPPLPPFVTQ